MSDNLNAGRVGAALGSGGVGKGWRTFFWMACIFNFAVGSVGMLSPESSLDGRIVGLLVFSLGIIYLLVARDPLRFAPVLWAGVVGKIGVVALLGPNAIAPSGDALIVGILALDALFAIGFLAFLLKNGDES